jgi:hypothetical protein
MELVFILGRQFMQLVDTFTFIKIGLKNGPGDL